MLETKLLNHIQTLNKVYFSEEQIYTYNEGSFYTSSIESETLEPLEFSQNVKLYDLKTNILASTDNTSLKVYHLKKNNRLVDYALTSTGSVSSIALSKFGMNTILGTEDGKVNIINNLSSESILKFTLFSNGDSVNNIAFIEENIIMGATKNNILLVDILEKGILSKISTNGTIYKIISCKDSIIYINNDKEIYFVDIKDFNNVSTKKLYSSNENIEDIIYNYLYDSIFILLKNKIFTIDFDLNINELDINVHNASNLSLINKNSFLISSIESSILVDNVLNNNDMKKENIEAKEKSIIRFLTVDDSATIRLVIKKSILNNFKNVEVIEAEDGIQAMEYLKKHSNIDVMLLDWNMPNMNGDEVVEAVSKISELSKMKIIMATTEGGKGKVKEMLSKGVKGYLVKPFRPNSVIPLIEKMIEIVKKERE